MAAGATEERLRSGAYDGQMPNDAVSAAVLGAAGECLADLDRIAWTYVREVRALTGYLESVVPDEELHETARRTLDLLFRLVRGEPRWEALRAHSEAIGRRRVRLGVPLESLLRAVRMDFRFIWQALAERAGTPAPDLSADVVAVWEVVEAHTTSVQTGYMEELARMRVELEHEQAFLLRRLLTDDAADPHLQQQAAASLGLPAEGPYLVAVPHRAFARRFTAVVAARTAATLLRLDGVDLVIAPDRPETRERLTGLQVGLSPSAADLARLGGMWRLARELAEWAEPDRAATVDRLWDRLAVRRLGPIAEAFAHDALAGLRDLPPRDGALLVEAVREHARTGSPPRPPPRSTATATP